MSKYVVIDMEMCKVDRCYKKNCRMGRETIQIGAVLLDDELEIADKFMTYVSPQCGTIDFDITNLTGITNRHLKGAPDMRKALEMLASWIPKDAVMMSWSMADRYQISKEMEEKEIHIQKIEDLFDSWRDCQELFSKKMGTEKVYKLSEALIVADIDYEENAHDGLVDAYNTALLFIKMQMEPKFKLNSYYSDASEESEGLGWSFGNLLSQFVFPDTEPELVLAN